ncbi:MAG: SMC-Scp complex subunit ScpB [Lachnospiraceae bacterium]
MEDKSMSISEMEGRIEAVLFSVGDAVSKQDLSEALEIDTDTLVKVVHNMMDRYDDEKSGIRIIEIEDAFQLCSKSDYYDTIIKIVNTPKKHVLTDVLLETLSIVAYKQPITRQEIEAIRGVSCVHAVNKLVEYHLIHEVGRLEAAGRPILFGTTDDFLRSFGVQSTDELPLITPDIIEDFKQQAMEEAQLSFPAVKD